jgi:hypothetical protein
MTQYPVTSFPNTAHSVFYSYTILGNGLPIGSFEKFSSSFDRTHERIREVFFNRGPITKEIVWGGADITITLSRVELYELAMFEAFGIYVYTIEDFNQVVDIVEIMAYPNNYLQPGGPPSPTTGLKTRRITYKDCVPTSMSKDVDTGTVRVVENMTLQCRTVEGEIV